MNGGFETGNWHGWTVSGGAFYCGNHPAGISTSAPHSGMYSACFGNPNTLTFISQTLATVPGQEYEISFWYAQQPPDQTVENEAQIIWGGSTLADVFNVPVRPWSFAAIFATATDTSTTIQFGFDNVPGWFALDDVSVDPVPEPEVAVLCGIGFALLTAFKTRAHRGI